MNKTNGLLLLERKYHSGVTTSTKEAVRLCYRNIYVVLIHTVKNTQNVK